MKVLTPRPELPANTLWNSYFMVRYNYQQSRSIEDIRRYGVRTTGIEEIDRDLPKQEITTQININRMFELYRKNVTVKIVNYNDCATIYEIIHAHILAWVSHLDHGINIDPEVIRDLIELDKFAAAVYEKAECVFSERDKQKFDVGIFTGFDAFNLFSLTTGKEEDEKSPFFVDNSKPVTRKASSHGKRFEDILAEHGERHGVWRDKS